MTVYRNVMPDDLPQDLLSKFQVLEMSGDWLKTVEDQVATTLRPTTMSLPRILKRGFDFLKEGNNKKADYQFETMLNTDDASNTAYAMAYVGKLMISINVKSLEELSALNEPFDEQYYYKKALNEGCLSTTQMLEGCNRRIKERKEYNRKLEIYDDAECIMKGAKKEEDYRKAANAFVKILDFKDSPKLHADCLEKAEACRKNDIYQSAMALMNQKTIEGYSSAIEIFNKIPEWNDSLERAEECRKTIEVMRVEFYAKGKNAMMRAKTQEDFIKASDFFNETKGYQEAKFLSEYTRKAANNAKKHDDLEALIGDMLNGSEATYRIIFEYLRKHPRWKNAETLERFLDWGLVYSNLLKRLEKYMNVRPGDIIQFGKYHQGANGEVAPIEWLVLDKQKNSLLLISRYVLDAKPYNEEYVETTWEECSLRKWLNEDFYQIAFDNEERILMAKTNVMAERNPEYDTNPGEDKEGNMFLPSIQEIRRYFGNRKERMCKPTEYARVRLIEGYKRFYDGIKSADKKELRSVEEFTEMMKLSIMWWLRSRGNNGLLASYVNDDGRIAASGYGVGNDVFGVRPALRIILNP